MVTAHRALREFYSQEQLPPDGGVQAKWVWVRAFGLPIPIPNTRARVRLVPYHDLHHVITGYRTDEAGEAEVAAWCLGTGGGPVLGHIYDLGAFLLGLFQVPRRPLRAFYRGRQGRNLYRKPAAAWMSWELDALRVQAHVSDELAAQTAADHLALVRTVLVAMALYGTPLLACFLALVSAFI